MKKIIIIIAALMLSTGVFAQRKGFYAPHVRVYVSPLNYGIGFGYPYGYFGYPMFGYPYGYGYSRMSSYSLDREITSIRTQYRYKIKAARKDKSIAKSQRKQEELSLKSDREKAINNAEVDFRRQRMNYRERNNYQNSGPNNNTGTNNHQDSGNNNNKNNNQNS